MLDIPSLALNIVRGIFAIAKYTRQMAIRVRTNQEECLRLSERVEMVIMVLDSDKLAHVNNMNLVTLLENFYYFLYRCCDFISTFVNANPFKSFRMGHRYAAQFRLFHEELNHYLHTLSLALSFIHIQPPNKPALTAPVKLEVTGPVETPVKIILCL